MNSLTKAQRRKYIKAVSEYLIELGYHVSPDYKRELIDVWGTLNRRRCYIEIYAMTIHPTANGIHGIWGQGDNEDEELYLDNERGLDTRFAPLLILENLKSFKRGRFK